MHACTTNSFFLMHEMYLLKIFIKMNSFHIYYLENRQLGFLYEISNFPRFHILTTSFALVTCIVSGYSNLRARTAVITGIRELV